MTTGTRVLTFEEWQAAAFTGGLGGGRSIAEMAWHARDAEIADLKRQLVGAEEHERLAVTAALRLASEHVPVMQNRIADDPSWLISRGACSCGVALADGVTFWSKLWQEHILVLISPTDRTALDAYVQERVAKALPSRDRLAKLLFEIDNKPGDAEWPEDWAIQPYCRWALRDAEKILAGLRQAGERSAT